MDWSSVVWAGKSTSTVRAATGVPSPSSFSAVPAGAYQLQADHIPTRPWRDTVPTSQLAFRELPPHRQRLSPRAVRETPSARGPGHRRRHPPLLRPVRLARPRRRALHRHARPAGRLHSWTDHRRQPDRSRLGGSPAGMPGRPEHHGPMPGIHSPSRPGSGPPGLGRCSPSWSIGAYSPPRPSCAGVTRSTRRAGRARVSPDRQGPWRHRRGPGWRPAAGVKADGRRFPRRADHSRRRTYTRGTTSIAQ
jgi:hypothetical protein